MVVVKVNGLPCDICGQVQYHAANCTWSSKATNENKYPEHDELRAVRDRSQEISRFLDWRDPKDAQIADLRRSLERCQKESEERQQRVHSLADRTMAAEANLEWAIKELKKMAVTAALLQEQIQSLLKDIRDIEPITPLDTMAGR